MRSRICLLSRRVGCGVGGCGKQTVVVVDCKAVSNVVMSFRYLRPIYIFRPFVHAVHGGRAHDIICCRFIGNGPSCKLGPVGKFVVGC